MSFMSQITSKAESAGLSFTPSPKSNLSGLYPDENENSFGDEIVALSDYFYNVFDIDGTDWAKTYGYELIVYDINSTKNARRFALPISPQSIVIDVPVATSLAVTMKGIIEENNGAPLRRISIRGTSGVLPYNFQPPQKDSGPKGFLESAFRNSINQVNRVVNDWKKLKNSAKNIFSGGAVGKRDEPLNISVTSEDVVRKNGYTFIHGLINFLDQYLAMKKQKKHKNVRLQFVMYKDKMYWDCTLNNYQIRKLPGTLEYEYDISLTAWRRATAPAIDNRQLTVINTTAVKQVNALSGMFNSVQNARRLVHSSVGVLNGIRSDIDQSFLTPMREAMMLGGEIAGAVKTLANFPRNLAQNAKSSWESSLIASKNAANNIVAEKLNKNLEAGGNYATTNVISSAITYQSRGPLDTTINEKENAGNNVVAEGSSPIDTIFNDYNNNLNFFDAFSIDSLDLSPAVQEAFDNEVARVRALTISDLKNNKTKMEEYAASISAGLGGGDSTYNRVNEQPTKSTYKKLSSDDITLLNALNDIIMFQDALINFTKQQDRETSANYFEYYSQLAQSNGLTFQNSKSKFFVPFPYGASLESLAVQYLGSSDRWIEIAALNGLKTPYIDEDGFEISFKSSGSGNTALVPYDDRLYVGQVVEIYSDTQSANIRKINSVDILSSVEMIITFSGDSDLSNYTVTQNAKIKAFLADTVNSLKLIAIPSDAPLTQNHIKTNPTQEDITFLTALSKTDFLLTTDGDLALTSGGDIKISAGLQNIIQAALIKLRTSAGAIISDPTFGNSAQAGRSVAEVDAKQLINNLKALFKDDDRFDDVVAAKATIMGGTVELQILLKVANIDYHLPLTTQLPL